MRVDVTHEPPAGWDEFVAGHPQASAFHRAAAVLIGRETFGLETRCLVARHESGELAGILPLVEQASWYLGRYLISLPFVTYGGMLSHDEAASAALVSSAAELARERRSQHVELRQIESPPGVELPARTDKIAMVLPLPGDSDALFAGFSSKLRSQIRRGKRENCEVSWGQHDQLPAFYEIFAITMHSLGTPVYPRRFFDVTVDALRDNCRICVLRSDNKPVAAACLVWHGSRVEVVWAGATLWAKKNSVNMHMYWELLSVAVESGAATLDFGRTSVDSGTWRFKKQWGASELQLNWHYWMREQGELPVLNHSNPKFELAVRLWRKLPLPIANTVGPWVSGNLP